MIIPMTEFISDDAVINAFSYSILNKFISMISSLCRNTNDFWEVKCQEN